MNADLSKIFKEMAELLEMEEVPFKPRAFETAAYSIESLDEEVNVIYKRGGVKELASIPGIGKGIAERIEEFVKTGKIKDYEQLKKKMPADVSELTVIEGIGPKSIKMLYKKLGIRNLDDLEKAAKDDKISGLPRFGKKTQDKILAGIKFSRTGRGRLLLGDVYTLAKDIEKELAALPAVSKEIGRASCRERV